VSFVVVRATVPTIDGLISEPPTAVTTSASTIQAFAPTAWTSGWPAGSPARPIMK
jgi:hypothetical protein